MKKIVIMLLTMSLLFNSGCLGSLNVNNDSNTSREAWYISFPFDKTETPEPTPTNQPTMSPEELGKQHIKHTIIKTIARDPDRYIADFVKVGSRLSSNGRRRFYNAEDCTR